MSAVTLLVLKLTLTPLLIVGATLAGRRWGHAVSGWIVGLPLTSAPVSLFVALQHDKTFAVHAAAGSIAGVVCECAMFVAWGVVAERGWPVGVAVGSVAFAAAGVATLHAWPLGVVAPLAVAVVAAAQFLLRSLPEPAGPAVRPPHRDLPARAVVATALVLALTAASGALGAGLTGLLAVYPLYSILLASFAQHAAGPVRRCQRSTRSGYDSSSASTGVISVFDIATCTPLGPSASAHAPWPPPIVS
jgi:hypothetical protein